MEPAGTGGKLRNQPPCPPNGLRAKSKEKNPFHTMDSCAYLSNTTLGRDIQSHFVVPEWFPGFWPSGTMRCDCTSTVPPKRLQIARKRKISADYHSSFIPKINFEKKCGNSWKRLEASRYFLNIFLQSFFERWSSDCPRNFLPADRPKNTPHLSGVGQTQESPPNGEKTNNLTVF